MKKIASFTIDHIKLQPGIYVSRKDYLGDQVITTYDIRMTFPIVEPVLFFVKKKLGHYIYLYQQDLTNRRACY